MLRVLYGYLMACSATDIPSLQFPRNEIIEIIPASYNNSSKRIHIPDLEPKLVPGSPQDIQIPVPASGTGTPFSGIGTPAERAHTPEDGVQGKDVKGGELKGEQQQQQQNLPHVESLAAHLRAQLLGSPKHSGTN